MFAAGALSVLAACGGVVLDTTLADTAEVRRAMLQSIEPGITTETQFVTRWGPPLQKVREGGRTEFIYRRQRDSTRFVIVTFDYGMAIAGRSNDFELCRATFAPRVPGYGFDQPSFVMPVGRCAPTRTSNGLSLFGAPAGPGGPGGGGADGSGGPAASGVPGVPIDRYDGGIGKADDLPAEVVIEDDPYASTPV